MSKLIEALQIFLKYGDPEWPTHCEHDVMYVSIDPTLVSPRDLRKLEALGFVPAKRDPIFMSYRYGSA